MILFQGMLGPLAVVSLPSFSPLTMLMQLYLGCRSTLSTYNSCFFHIAAGPLASPGNLQDSDSQFVVRL